jgi:hypothetical protein
MLREFSAIVKIHDSKGRAVSLSHTHRFRHTKLTRLAEVGPPIHVLQRYAGPATNMLSKHSSPTRSGTSGSPGPGLRRVATFSGRAWTVCGGVFLGVMRDRARGNTVFLAWGPSCDTNLDGDPRDDDWARRTSGSGRTAGHGHRRVPVGKMDQPLGS